MTAEELEERCLALAGAVLEYPFGRAPELATFKVEGKVFALSRLAVEPLQVSLKCDPAMAEDLREQHAAIQPGWHLNKRHWNTVTLDGSLDDQLVFDLIEDSYDLVVDKLPRKTQRALGVELRRRG